MRGVVRLLLLLGLVLAGSSVSTVAASAAVAPGVTKVNTAPKAVTSARTATLTFSTTQLGASYECKLVVAGSADPGPDAGWEACGPTAASQTVAPGAGTKAYNGLETGLHTFSVRATTPSGDPNAPVRSNTATTAWTVAAGPVTEITAQPRDRAGAQKSGAPNPTYRFSADQDGVTFLCSFTRQGEAQVFQPCGTTAGRTGSFVAAPTAPGPHTFAVKATKVLTGDAAQTDTTILCSVRTSVCKLTAPSAFSVPAGVKFNDPLGNSVQQRRLLNHVNETVKSMPGFAVSDPAYCSDDPADFPSRIRISVYSVTSTIFAGAMVAADKRCVSVQMLMNNHLSPDTTDAIRQLREGLGTAVARTRTVNGVATKLDERSFAAMCGNVGSNTGSCRGGAVLHSKFNLFDSPVKAPNGATRIYGTVMVGSANLTANGTQKQWNNMLTVRSNPTLFAQYAKVFDIMKRNVPDRRTYDFRTGAYSTYFWPRGSTDPQMSGLNSIRCTGVKGGAGYRGRTLVYVNMHAWFGTRGYAYAKKIRSLHDRGCYVRVLYGFMSYSVFKKLKAGTGSRMMVRRTLFSTDGDKYADIYSHFKVIAASGNVSGNPAARVTWTGSMNLTNNGVGFDEVWMRVASSSVFAAYRDNWNYINKRKASSTYAHFEEPIGGGRPVAEDGARRMVQPTEPLVVLPQENASKNGLPTD